MVDSPPGEIPKGWGTKSLYDCAEFVNGAAYSDFDFAPDRSGLPVVKISELKDGVTLQTKFTHTDLGTKYRIDSRDMLYSWSGSPDTSLDVFTWMGGPAWLNQHIFRVDLHSSYERCFVYCLLRTLKPILVEIARDKQTTGLGHVTTRDMKGLQVVEAPANVLRRFEESVGPIYDRRMLNESESRTLAAIRDALLPKLMSGEVRVMS
jgi:type I restriction enzyme S subunit